MVHSFLRLSRFVGPSYRSPPPQATDEQKGVLGALLVAVARVAAQEKLEGYRVVINDGEGAGQSVFHLHAHILAGRPLAWCVRERGSAVVGDGAVETCMCA